MELRTDVLAAALSLAAATCAWVTVWVTAGRISRLKQRVRNQQVRIEGLEQDLRVEPELDQYEAVYQGDNVIGYKVRGHGRVEIVPSHLMIDVSGFGEGRGSRLVPTTAPAPVGVFPDYGPVHTEGSMVPEDIQVIPCSKCSSEFAYGGEPDGLLDSLAQSGWTQVDGAWTCPEHKEEEASEPEPAKPTRGKAAR